MQSTPHINLEHWRAQASALSSASAAYRGWAGVRRRVLSERQRPTTDAARRQACGLQSDGERVCVCV